MNCESVLELLLIHSIATIPDSEKSLVQGHLEDCSACQARQGSLRDCFLQLKAPLSPPDHFWETIVMKSKSTKKPITPAILPTSNVAISVERCCTYCKGNLTQDLSVYCAACLARYHEECFSEHATCSVSGCQSTQIVRPTPAKRNPPPRTRSRNGPVIAFALFCMLGMSAVSTLMMVLTNDSPGEEDVAVSIGGSTERQVDEGPVIVKGTHPQGEFTGDSQRAKQRALIASLFAAAEARYSNGKYTEAQELVASILNLEPEHTRALRLQDKVKLGLANQALLSGPLGKEVQALSLKFGIKLQFDGHPKGPRITEIRNGSPMALATTGSKGNNRSFELRVGDRLTYVLSSKVRTISDYVKVKKIIDKQLVSGRHWSIPIDVTRKKEFLAFIIVLKDH